MEGEYLLLFSPIHLTLTQEPINSQNKKTFFASNLSKNNILNTTLRPQTQRMTEMVDNTNNNEKIINKILIIVAMEGILSFLSFFLDFFLSVAEASPTIKEFNLIKEETIDNISKLELYKGEYAGSQISLITNGKCPITGCDEVSPSSSFYLLFFLFIPLIQSLNQ